MLFWLPNQIEVIYSLFGCLRDFFNIKNR
jgi:hypothetical protein